MRRHYAGILTAIAIALIAVATFAAGRPKNFEKWSLLWVREYPFGGSVDNRGAYQEFAVYLPAGRWMNYNDRKTVYDGGVSLTVGATQATIPLYVREGAIITRGDILKGNNNRGRELGTEVADRGISRPEGWE